MIKVIESGGDIEELRGKKNKKKNTKASKKGSKDDQNSSDLASTVNSSTSSSTQDLPGTQEDNSATRSKKVTQFSYLGYSLGGLIGRFAMGMLAEEGFFDEVEPVYFVTMATPHLGIRQPPLSNWSKIFNFLSSRMLSRTGTKIPLFFAEEAAK